MSKSNRANGRAADREVALLMMGKRKEQCARPRCYRETESDWLYCSNDCYARDNPMPISVRIR